MLKNQELALRKARTNTRHHVIAVLLSGMLGTLPTSVFAWGSMGHEVASDLAISYLSPQTTEQIQLLLPNETLAEASTWADRMRSDPDPFWQREASPYHYVTVPPGKSYAEVGAPEVGDAITALSRFSRELRDPTLTLEERQRALRFGIHIVQDVQQPLHVGNGRDRGGNDVTVYIDGKPETFHWLWDSLLFESQDLTAVEWKSRIANNPDLRAPTIHDSDPLRWISESGALRDRIYPPPTTLNTAYLRIWLPVAEKRIALAAVRTAAWLNWVFAEPKAQIL